MDRPDLQWWSRDHELHRDLVTGSKDLHVDLRALVMRGDDTYEWHELHLHRGCHQREWKFDRLGSVVGGDSFNGSWEPNWCECCQRRHTSHGVMDGTIVKWRIGNYWLYGDFLSGFKDLHMDLRAFVMHREDTYKWHELHLHRGCQQREWKFDCLKPLYLGDAFNDSRYSNSSWCSQGRWSGTHYVDGTLVKWWISYYELYRDLNTGVEDLHVDNRIALVHRQWPHQRLELHLHCGCHQREWILEPLECNSCGHPFNGSWEPNWCKRR